MKQSKIYELHNQTILNNPKHYKKTITHHWKEIMDKYLEVLLEYMKSILDNTKIKRFSPYPSIIIRGLDTITHVFRWLFYYTKNLNMTFYNTQRAYYYYIEFVDQMSEEEISYLKLNSNDAILYVYKKTIYQLNEEHQKNREPLQEKEKIIFELLEEYIYMIKSVLFDLIETKEYDISKIVAIVNEKYQEFSQEKDVRKQIQILKKEKWRENS